MQGARGTLPRRAVLRDGLAAALAATGAAAVLDVLPAEAKRKHHGHKGHKGHKGDKSHTLPHNILKDAGVGTYVDMSSAQQLSAFTINPRMVSCAVGTVALSPEFSGPFAMLMFATHLDHYVVNHAKGSLHAQGHMRSITHVAGQTVEDIEHEFAAIATDGRFKAKRFDVHFVTPFWTPGSNAMATPSTDFDGLARFGGRLVTGFINAGG
jgi:hypothetical protein